MNIETKNGMKIITPKFGCKLHNKETDTYTKIAYLPLDASLDKWEEVYEDNSGELYDKIENLVELLQAICKSLNIKL